VTKEVKLVITTGEAAFLPRDAMHSAAYAVLRCLSAVRLSVCHRTCKHMLRRFYHRVEPP